MVGIYFSGTGNTAHCITKLVHLLDETAEIYSPLSDEEGIPHLLWAES